MKKTKSSRKEVQIVSLCLFFSVVTGLLSKDLLIGGAVVATGLTSAYYASKARRVNYLLGCGNYLLMAYVSWKNHLYGIFGFYTFLFAPLQLQGFFMWKKHSDEADEVPVRRFTLAKGIVIIFISVLCSLIVGFGLSLIPNQQLSYLDAFTNCINLFGVVLMIQRYQEAFWLWLINNVIDLVIWTLVLTRGGENALMMFLASVGFLVINLYGIVNWHQRAKLKEME